MIKITPTNYASDVYVSRDAILEIHIKDDKAILITRDNRYDLTVEQAKKIVQEEQPKEPIASALRDLIYLLRARLH